MSKTLLSSFRQCERTVELAESWTVSAKKIIASMANANVDGTYGLADWQEGFKRRKSMYAEIERTLLPNTHRKNIGNYLDVLSGFQYEEDWAFGDPWIPGCVRQNDRHFIAGDIVLVLFSNGTDRHPIWAVTSKGHRISGYYYNTNRCDPEKGFIELLPVPGELVGIQLADPAVQKYLSTLRAGLGPRPGRRV